MSIFTNWIFWIVLSTTLFAFALIGFLTDKKKRKGKSSEGAAVNNSDVNNPIEVLDGTNGSTFNLDSPVQKEVKRVSESVLTVQNDNLGVSGDLSFEGTESLNSGQEIINDSLGESVRTSEADSMKDVAVRNQVDLDNSLVTSGDNVVQDSNNLGQPMVNSLVTSGDNVVQDSNNLGQPMVNSNFQSTERPSSEVNLVLQQVNDQVNMVNNLDKVSNGTDKSSMDESSVNNYEQNVNVIAESSQSGTTGEVQTPANSTIIDETSANAEKIYDTWT